MPWGAAMTSTLKIPTRTYAQVPSGEWKPTVTYAGSGVVSVPCRIFPANERDIRARWGEGLRVDCLAWIGADVSLPPEVLSADAGQQTPVQVDGVAYMVIKVRDLGHMGKLKEVALRRYTHG